MGKKLGKLFTKKLVLVNHVLEHSNCVVEEQLHVPSYRNASVHTCTCTTMSERKSPWHLVGSLVSQTDETTSWGTDM